jgi:Putative prokaryotic signal transducing protein
MSVKGWTVVYKGERFQAEIIAAALNAEGLRAEVFGDSAYGVGINLTEARLMVPDGQAEAARRVIRAAESKPSEQAEDQV